MVELGHVVYYVRDLSASLRFYRDAVGLKLGGKIFSGRGAILTGGSTHHELLLLEAGKADGPLTGKRIGLYHVGWKVGADLSTLRQVKQHIEQMGYMIDGMADHTISHSLYLRDPDNNEVELYVDNPACNWKDNDNWMQEPVKPLRL